MKLFDWLKSLYTSEPKPNSGSNSNLTPLPITVTTNQNEIRKVSRSLGRLGRLYQAKARGDIRLEIDTEIVKCKHLIAAEGLTPPQTISEVETLQKLLGD